LDLLQARNRGPSHRRHTRTNFVLTPRITHSPGDAPTSALPSIECCLRLSSFDFQRNKLRRSSSYLVWSSRAEPSHTRSSVFRENQARLSRRHEIRTVMQRSEEGQREYPTLSSPLGRPSDRPMSRRLGSGNQYDEYRTMAYAQTSAFQNLDVLSTHPFADRLHTSPLHK
jgi:hypothetical protein